MTEKKFKGAPFGTQKARFDVSAVHPNHKRVGTYTQIPYCKRMTSKQERNRGPSTYNTDRGDFSAKAVQERAKGPGWKRAEQIEFEAQRPHLLYKDAWENKQLLKTKVGPGTYSIPSFIDVMENKPGSVRGICDSGEARFKFCQSSTPGPGTYGRGGMPSVPLEDMEKRSQMSSHMSLQRSTDKIVQGSGLGPGTYNFISSTDQILKRRISKRGPYDLCTSYRNKPITRRCFSEMISLNSKEYIKEMPAFGEDFQKPERRKHGVFSSLEQYPATPTERICLSTLSQCPRPVMFPGPGWYDVIPKNPVHQIRDGTQAPFLTSAPRISKSTPCKNHNMFGPAYKITKSTQGHSSSFKSGPLRYPNCLARDKQIQERLKPTNVLLDKSFHSA